MKKVYIVLDKDTGEELACEESQFIAQNKLVQFLTLGINAYMIAEKSFFSTVPAIM